jgi:serine/threonine protein kinase
MLKRFQREARALKKLTHPNIVPFYGLYEAEDIMFLLEYFVNGPTLKDVLRNHKGFLSLTDTLAYLQPICAALGYAHANGIVHCDVKPGNVMLDASGQVFLTDFGIVRHAESSNTTFASAGTPGYMAPEQIRGEPLSPATDVYALGVLLYEMLTGRRPFRGDEAATTTAGATNAERIRYGHLSVRPTSPREFNETIPADVETVLLKALEKQPSGRYNNAADFYSALLSATGLSAEKIPSLPYHQTVTVSEAKEFNHGQELLPANSPGKPNTSWIMGGGIILIALIGIWILTSKSSLTPAGESTSPGVIFVDVTATTDQQPRAVPTSANNSSAGSKTISPSKTPNKKIATATPKPGKLYYPLADCAPSHLHVGDWAIVPASEKRLKIRSYADTHPSDNIIDAIYTGDKIYITEGPVCNYGWILWKADLPNGNSGWVTETDGKGFFLQITEAEIVNTAPAQTSCSSLMPTRLSKGSRAQVSKNGVANKIRDGAGINYAKIGSIPAGGLVDLLDGPICADGYLWWKIMASNGKTGWTAEGDNISYYLNPYP